MLNAVIFAGAFTLILVIIYRTSVYLIQKRIQLRKEQFDLEIIQDGNQDARQSPEYRKWSADVKKRDGWCIFCHSTEHLEAHHIYSFSSFPELRFDITNGITLCSNCHKLTPNYGSKEKTFSQRIINSK